MSSDRLPQKSSDESPNNLRVKFALGAVILSTPCLLVGLCGFLLPSFEIPSAWYAEVRTMQEKHPELKERVKQMMQDNKICDSEYAELQEYCEIKALRNSLGLENEPAADR